MAKVDITCSNRRFDIAGIENKPFMLDNLGLQHILQDDGSELNYCIRELEIDRILDMHVGQTITIRASRDNESFIAFIKRQQ